MAHHMDQDKLAFSINISAEHPCKPSFIEGDLILDLEARTLCSVDKDLFALTSLL